MSTPVQPEPGWVVIFRIDSAAVHLQRYVAAEPVSAHHLTAANGRLGRWRDSGALSL